MITLTPAAAEQIKALMDEPGLMLEVSLQGGGCSGLSYTLNITPKEAYTGLMHQSQGVVVGVPSEAAERLAGTVIGYSGGLKGKGFTFSNPNATKSCGCGTSFACE
jgi:iron-sulfur cluster assembly protein